MSYRNDVDALAARHAALDAELAAKTKELNDASRLLEEARERARLPVLDHIRIATPCRADWNEMVGDERVRTCAACAKQVFNLSMLTRDEAEALIAEKNGELCARYYQRKDGTILLADCTVGGAGARNRRLAAAGAAAVLASGAYALTHRDRPAANAVSVAASPEELGPGHLAATAHELQPPPPPPPSFQELARKLHLESLHEEVFVTAGAISIESPGDLPIAPPDKPSDK